jgi:site-specific DNA-methyltransferase (adenine-specific)
MCLAQFWRVLKPAGSLYLFSGHRLASDIEIMMRNRFNILNHIIWAKPSGRWNGCNKESLRSYSLRRNAFFSLSITRGPYKPKSDGFSEKSNEVKQHVMAPLISYFRDARTELGVTSANSRCHWKEKHGVPLFSQPVAITKRAGLRKAAGIVHSYSH